MTGSSSDLLFLISRYPLFDGLPDSTKLQLTELLQIERYSPNKTIFRFNDPGDKMYFLCEGSVRFVTRDYTGHEVVLEEIQPGDLFGEVAIFTGGERAADAVTTGQTTLLSLRRELRKEFVRCCPEVAEIFVTRIAARLASSNRLLRTANIGIEATVEAERSFFDRIVKKLVDVFGTLPSFVLHITIIVLWIVLKWVFQSPLMNFEKPELLILSVLLNVEGFAVSMLILVNQARESKEESVRDETEFEATVHTDNAIRYMHQKMDVLTAELHRLRHPRKRSRISKRHRARIQKRKNPPE